MGDSGDERGMMGLKVPAESAASAEAEEAAGASTDVDESRLQSGTSTLVDCSSASTREAATEGIAVGVEVQARYLASVLGSFGTRWYPGRVTKVHDDGSADIAYDDGDVEHHVHPKY